MVAFCLFWGGQATPLQSVFGISLRQSFLYGLDITPNFLRIQSLALLAVPLMLWPRRRRTPLPKWIGYAAYPGHLLLLWLVELATGVMTMEQSLRLLFPWR